MILGSVSLDAWGYMGLGLQYHLEAKPAVSPEADALALARSTPGFSGADLANLINVAAWEAAKDDALEIGLKHLDAGKVR